MEIKKKKLTTAASNVIGVPPVNFARPPKAIVDTLYKKKNTEIITQ